MMYRRNIGHLPANTIDGLPWNIVADSAQIFYNFNSAEDVNAMPQVNMPASNLAVRRSLLTLNMHIASMDTPKHWLVVIPPTGDSKNALGRSRQ